MTKKRISFYKTLEPYHHDCWFVFGDSKKQLLNRVKSKLDFQEIKELQEQLEGANAFAIIFSSGRSMVYLSNYPETTEQHGTMVHELLHIVSMVLRRVGIKHTSKTEEAYAYLIGWLTMEVLDEIWTK